MSCASTHVISYPVPCQRAAIELSDHPRRTEVATLTSCRRQPLRYWQMAPSAAFRDGHVPTPFGLPHAQLALCTANVTPFQPDDFAALQPGVPPEE